MNKIFPKMLFIFIIFILLGCDKKDISLVNPDAIYVINLDRIPERLENTKKQLNAFGFNPIKFSAIDGFDISLVHNKNEKIIIGKQRLQNLRHNITTTTPESYYVKYNGQYQNAEFNLTRTAEISGACSRDG